MIRIFGVTLLGELLVIAVSRFLNLRAVSWDNLKITVWWVFAFAVCNSAVLFPLKGSLQKSRRHAVLSGIAVALLAYIAVVVISAGYIRNLGYPLLLLFLAGSVPASLTISESKTNIERYSPVIAFLLILALGALSSVVVKYSLRQERIRVAVVKLTGSSGSNLVIGNGLGIIPTGYEIDTLKGLGLRGNAQITQIVEYGPKNSSVNHMMIIMTRPLTEDVRLPEAKGDVTFLQQETGWTRIPASTELSWRQVELYRATPDCTMLSVWKSLGHQNITQALCWK